MKTIIQMSEAEKPRLYPYYCVIPPAQFCRIASMWSAKKLREARHAGYGIELWV